MSWEKYLQERKDKRNKLEEWERSVEKTKNHYEEFANSVGIILQKCGNLSTPTRVPLPQALKNGRWGGEW